MSKLIENPLTTHKHARWFALIAYLLGALCIVVGYVLPPWGAYVMQAGIVLWIIPVMWVAYRWSKP